MTVFLVIGNKFGDPKLVFKECIKCYVAMSSSLIMISTSGSNDFENRKRICNLTIMMCGMLMYWLWEAQLINDFAFPSTGLPFLSIKGLLEKSDKKVCRNYSISKFSPGLLGTISRPIFYILLISLGIAI